MDPKDIIRNGRLKLDLTMAELAERVGVSEATVSRWESGEVANMKRSNISTLAKVLGISPVALIGGCEENEPNERLSVSEKAIITKYRALDYFGKKAVSDLLDTEFQRVNYEKEKPATLDLAINQAKSKYTKQIPFTGKVSASLGVSAIEDCNTTYGPDNADLALLIDGDSMEPLYHSGDMVYIKRQQIVESGQIAVVQVYNEYEDFIPKAYLKKVKINGENGTASLISLNNKYDEKIIPLNELTILGKVIGTN